jgi:hypothetical protein
MRMGEYGTQAGAVPFSGGGGVGTEIDCRADCQEMGSGILCSINYIARNNNNGSNKYHNMTIIWKHSQEPVGAQAVQG